MIAFFLYQKRIGMEISVALERLAISYKHDKKDVMWVDTGTLKKLIKQKEGIQIELKSAKQGFLQSAYESLAAFLNRNGGHLILGVEDDGQRC